MIYYPKSLFLYILIKHSFKSMKSKMLKYFPNLTVFYEQHPSANINDTGYVISADSSEVIGTPGIPWDSICFIETEKLIWTHGEFFAEAVEEIDPTVPSYVKSITQANINNWNSYANVQADWNDSNTSSMSYILNKPDISVYFDDVEYDKTNKLINFKHNNVVKDTLDATDFIKDGMVDTAYLGKGTTTGKENKDCLIIRFNTDAGKEDIEILLADIFNPDNYYDISDANELFATFDTLNSYVSKTELSSQSYITSTTLNTRLNTAGYISLIPSEYITQTELSANGYLTSETKANWNETNSSSAAYIQNKPTIPAAANDSTITIQKGGTNVDTFTTNAASNKTINIPNELPSYSSSDSGKILSVNSSGQLVWITPISIYTGSGEPNNANGNDGDIYLQS